LSLLDASTGSQVGAEQLSLRTVLAAIPERISEECKRIEKVYERIAQDYEGDTYL
jgi:hypothetical protein